MNNKLLFNINSIKYSNLNFLFITKSQKINWFSKKKQGSNLKRLQRYV